MRSEKRKVGNKRNLVSSFITAFVGSGSIESACIKFAMFDGTTRLSYWEPRWFLALYECVEYYSGIHYYGSDLQRTAEEPEFLVGLPKRHAVRTMNDEKPHLTGDEYQTARERFPVASLAVIDEGATCRIECSYLGGDRRIEVLPAFIAMNLRASLKASVVQCLPNLLKIFIKHACDARRFRLAPSDIADRPLPHTRSLTAARPSPCVHPSTIQPIARVPRSCTNPGQTPSRALSRVAGLPSLPMQRVRRRARADAAS